MRLRFCNSRTFYQHLGLTTGMLSTRPGHPSTFAPSTPSPFAFSRFCLSWVKRASSSCHSAACTQCTRCTQCTQCTKSWPRLKFPQQGRLCEAFSVVDIAADEYWFLVWYASCSMSFENTPAISSPCCPASCLRSELSMGCAESSFVGHL